MKKSRNKPNEHYLALYQRWKNSNLPVSCRCSRSHQPAGISSMGSPWICAVAASAIRIYSLAGLVQNGLHLDPTSGDVFVFVGKRGNQVRVPQWDGDGYALYIKRLEAGTFERPKGGKLLIPSRELLLILQGVKLTSVQLRKRYQRVGTD